MGLYALLDACMHLFMTAIFLDAILVILVFVLMPRFVLDFQRFGHASVLHLHINILAIKNLSLKNEPSIIVYVVRRSVEFEKVCLHE
jgi:hypothetical protein